MTTCCTLHPMCYCVPIEPTRAERILLRRAVENQAEDEHVRQIRMIAAFKRARRRAVVRLSVGIFFLVAAVVLVAALAACRPLDGPRPLPTPSTSEMFTVIRPGNHLGGGIYDNK